MHGVAGEEYATPALVVGEQQVLLPFADVEHLEGKRHRDRLRELAEHVAVLLNDGPEREMPSRILQDQLRRVLIHHVIMPPFADGNALVELVATVESLPEPEDV